MNRNIEPIKIKLKKNKHFLKTEYGVKEIGLFGSFARGEEKKNSDMDIIVEFEKPIGLLKLINLENYLSDLIEKKVDLVPKEDIREELKERILAETVYL